MDHQTSAANHRNSIFFILLAAGGMGILSGFCIFMLLNEKMEEGKVPEFLAILAVAVLASFIIESFKGIIESGEAKLEPSRIMVAVVMLIMFEIVVLAWEGLPEMKSHFWQHTVDNLLGADLKATGHPWLHLIALASLWTVAGMIMAVVIGYFATRATASSLKSQVASGGWCGIWAGILIAPIGTLLFILFVRAAQSIYELVFDHEVWKQHLQALADANVDAPPLLLLRPGFRAMLWTDNLFSQGWWGPIVGLGVVVAAVMFVYKSKFNIFSFFIVGAVIAILFGPLLAYLPSLKMLLLTPILAALAWCVPGLVLGMLAPLLRHPSKQPRYWGMLAALAAVILVGATWSRFHYWFVLPAVLLVMAAVCLPRGDALEEYWPVVALSVGIIVCCGTWVVQEATFAGVFRYVQNLTNTPDYLPPPPPPPDPFSPFGLQTNALPDLHQRSFTNPWDDKDNHFADLNNDQLGRMPWDDHQSTTRPSYLDGILFGQSTTRPSLLDGPLFGPQATTIPSYIPEPATAPAAVLEVSPGGSPSNQGPGKAPTTAPTCICREDEKSSPAVESDLSEEKFQELAQCLELSLAGSLAF